MTASDSKGRARSRRRPTRLAGMGFELAAAVAGFTFLGIWIDRRYETDPWGLLICAGIGVVGGLYNFVRTARLAAESASRSTDSEDRPESEG